MIVDSTNLQQEPVASKIHFHPSNNGIKLDKKQSREQQIALLKSLNLIFERNPELKIRFEKVTSFANYVII